MQQSEVVLKTVNEFVIMACSGMFLGFVFDIFRSMRSAVRKNKGKTPDFIVILQDILFLIFCFIFVVLLVYSLNGGAVKGYIVAGGAIGFALYFYALAPFAGKIVFFVFFCLLWLVRHMILGAAAVLRLLNMKIKRFFGPGFRKIITKIRFNSKKIQNLSKNQ